MAGTSITLLLAVLALASGDLVGMNTGSNMGGLPQQQYQPAASLPSENIYFGQNTGFDNAGYSQQQYAPVAPTFSGNTNFGQNIGSNNVGFSQPQYIPPAFQPSVNVNFGQNTGSNMAGFPQSPKPTPPSPPSVNDRIKAQPSPVPSFNINAWLGPWVLQYQKAPCSWAISEEFTDFTQVLELQGKLLVNHETSRNNNICNKITSVLSMTSPGQFSGKDPTGLNWSGVVTVVATDYKRFSISWGCTRWAAFDGVCDDPWIVVKTRQRKVSARVRQQIDAALQNLFGVSVNELTTIKHGKPCARGMKQ